MLTVVTWWWSTPGYRTVFTAEHVNTLARMTRRHYPDPHRFVVVTNENTSGLEPGIDVVADDADFADLPGSRPGYPSCYRRLRMFKRDIAAVFGQRFVSLDMDVVITSALRPVWNRPEDFVVWGYTSRVNPYNMSMVMMNAGARPQVWEKFNPLASPYHARTAGFFGSDQAWLSYVLGVGEARWSVGDGVYSFINDFRHQPQAPLPPNARMIFFHGHVDPWLSEVQVNHPWIVAHYR